MYTLRRSKFVDSGSRNPGSLEETLYKICSREVEELIHHACRNIQRIYGNYDEEICRQKVEDLQIYILANLPAVVIDDLCGFRISSKTFRGECEDDLRIDLALYIHRNMRKFFIRHFNEISLLGVDCTFWAMQLSKLQNLVVLDLELYCTDEILKIVSENCQKLAYTNIVSRVEAMHVKQCKPIHFNALKLQYCVSDVGLGYLCKCKLLRKIKMNKILRSHFGGGVTLGGIRKLVRSLPLLQHITFEDMGMVLADEMEDVRHLSLTSVSDFHPRPAHIDAISRLCPDLKQLCLRSFSTRFAPTELDTLLANEADVLRVLASSGLKVCELQLIQFLFSSELARVIEVKGIFLNSLEMEYMGSITSETIQLIGRMCPNLMNLHLSEGKTPDEIVSRTNPQCFDMYPAGGTFGSLQCLTLTGRTWELDILPLCLTPAKDLKVLNIYNMSRAQGSLDATMMRIISTNSLQKLRIVNLMVRSRLTIGTIEYFYRNCPKLMELSFLRTAHLPEEHARLLCIEIMEQHFTWTASLREWEP